jgi:hypothetical protein
MVYNALRGYLQLASGLTEVTKQRATEAARALSSQLGIQGEDALAGAGVAAGIATAQVQAMAEELLASARSNRRLLTELVRAEVDRGVSRLGLVEAHQLEYFRAALSQLEEQVAVLRGMARTGGAVRASAPSAVRPPVPPAKPPASKATGGEARPLRTPATKAATEPAAKAPAKKVPAKKLPAKKVPAKQVPAKQVTARKVTAKKVTAKQVPAKQVPAKQVPAKQVTARKVPAKKAAESGPPA